MDIQAREAELSCDAVQLYGIHSETILEVLLNYSKADQVSDGEQTIQSKGYRAKFLNTFQ